MLRRASTALLCLLPLTAVSQTGTISVTASGSTIATLPSPNFVEVTASNLKDSTGQLPLNGTLCFAPANNAAGPQSFALPSGGQGTQQPSCANVVNGAITTNVATGGSPFTLANTNNTYPANLCYNVSATQSSDGSTVFGGGTPSYSSGYNCVQMNSNWCSVSSGITICNFDLYVPMTPALLATAAPNLSSTVPTTTLSPGASATAAVTALGSGQYQLQLGIPAGAAGPNCSGSSPSGWCQVPNAASFGYTIQLGVSSYAGYQTAMSNCTGTGSLNNCHLYISGLISLSSPLTVPPNVTLNMQQGGGFTSTSAQTLTIQGGFSAAAGEQVFFGGISPIFADPATVIHSSWFGYNGNTTTDSVAPLNYWTAAVDAAPGFKAVLDPGAYNVDSSVTGPPVFNGAVGDDIDLSGATIKLTTTPNTIASPSTYRHVPVLVCNGCQKVKIHGGTLLGNADYTNASQAETYYAPSADLALINSSAVEVSGMELDNCGEACIYGSGSSSLYIHNNRLIGPGSTYFFGGVNPTTGGAGVVPPLGNYSFGVYLVYPPVTSALLSGYQSVLSIQDNDIEYVGTGLSTADNYDQILLENNRFHRIIAQHGNYIDGCNNCIISGNDYLDVEDTPIKFNSAFGAVNVLVSNNNASCETAGMCTGASVLLTRITNGTAYTAGAVTSFSDGLHSSCNAGHGIALTINNVADGEPSSISYSGTDSGCYVGDTLALTQGSATGAVVYVASVSAPGGTITGLVLPSNASNVVVQGGTYSNGGYCVYASYASSVTVQGVHCHNITGQAFSISRVGLIDLDNNVVDGSLYAGASLSPLAGGQVNVDGANHFRNTNMVTYGTSAEDSVITLLPVVSTDAVSGNIGAGLHVSQTTLQSWAAGAEVPPGAWRLGTDGNIYMALTQGTTGNTAPAFAAPWTGTGYCSATFTAATGSGASGNFTLVTAGFMPWGQVATSLVAGTGYPYGPWTVGTATVTGGTATCPTGETMPVLLTVSSTGTVTAAKMMDPPAIADGTMTWGYLGPPSKPLYLFNLLDNFAGAGTQIPSASVMNVGPASNYRSGYSSDGRYLTQMPVSAGYSTSAVGSMGYDITAGNWHAYTNGADALVMTLPAATTVTNGHLAVWQVSGSTINVGDGGVPGGTGVSTIGAITAPGTCGGTTACGSSPGTQLGSVTIPSGKLDSTGAITIKADLASCSGSAAPYSNCTAANTTSCVYTIAVSTSSTGSTGGFSQSLTVSAAKDGLYQTSIQAQGSTSSERVSGWELYNAGSSVSTIAPQAESLNFGATMYYVNVFASDATTADVCGLEQLRVELHP